MDSELKNAGRANYTSRRDSIQLKHRPLLVCAWIASIPRYSGLRVGLDFITQSNLYNDSHSPALMSCIFGWQPPFNCRNRWVSGYSFQAMIWPRKPVCFRTCIYDDRPLLHTILCLLIGIALLDWKPKFHCLNAWAEDHKHISLPLKVLPSSLRNIPQ